MSPLCHTTAAFATKYSVVAFNFIVIQNVYWKIVLPFRNECLSIRFLSLRVYRFVRVQTESHCTDWLTVSHFEKFNTDHKIYCHTTLHCTMYNVLWLPSHLQPSFWGSTMCISAFRTHCLYRFMISCIYAKYYCSSLCILEYSNSYIVIVYMRSLLQHCVLL